MINAFAKQLGGNLEIHRHDPGVEFILVFPKTASSLPISV
jgi:two-component sensor histidine kinase